MRVSLHPEHTLPVEVLFLILEQVILDDDIQVLKAMSTVSRAFHPSCRKHLFRRIIITISSDDLYAQRKRHSADSFLEFAAFLTSNSHVLKSIRRLVLLEVSGTPNWSIEPPAEDEENRAQRWRTVAEPLTRILEGIEYLQSLEIRSDIELDWASFDVGIKRAVYALLRRPSCADAEVRLAALSGIGDADLLALVEPCADVALTQVRFDLSGGRTAAAAVAAVACASPGTETQPGRLLPGNPADIKEPALWRLRLGREMGLDALDWLVHHPDSLAGVRHLTMESFSAASSLEDMWKFAQGTRHSLEHLEWWLEDLGFREPADAIALQQINLSIFPHLRSLTVRSSQTGSLVNLMVIFEATGPTNCIEEITIVMPSNIDKATAFVHTMVWKRVDSALARYRNHLRSVILSFAWTNRPLQARSLSELFSAFKQNLPSLRGKDLRVEQRKAFTF